MEKWKNKWFCFCLMNFFRLFRWPFLFFFLMNFFRFFFISFFLFFLMNFFRIFMNFFIFQVVLLGTCSCCACLGPWFFLGMPLTYGIYGLLRCCGMRDTYRAYIEANNIGEREFTTMCKLCLCDRCVVAQTQLDIEEVSIHFWGHFCISFYYFIFLIK